jgi:hypothetical protein
MSEDDKQHDRRLLDTKGLVMSEDDKQHDRRLLDTKGLVMSEDDKQHDRRLAGIVMSERETPGTPSEEGRRRLAPTRRGPPRTSRTVQADRRLMGDKGVVMSEPPIGSDRRLMRGVVISEGKKRDL